VCQVPLNMTEKPKSYWTKRRQIRARVAKHFSDSSQLQAVQPLRVSAASCSFATSALTELQPASGSHAQSNRINAHHIPDVACPVSDTNSSEFQRDSDMETDDALLFDGIHDSDSPGFSSDEEPEVAAACTNRSYNVPLFSGISDKDLCICFLQMSQALGV